MTDTSKDIWLVISKIKPIEGCTINHDGCEFYYVDGYVPVDSNQSVKALELISNIIEKSLREKRLELVEILLCCKFKNENWIDNTAAPESIHDLASKSLELNSVQFGRFRSEEFQELYVYQHKVDELDV